MMRFAPFFVFALVCHGRLRYYNGMVVDRSGNIWIAGATNTYVSIPVTPDAFQPNPAAGNCGGYVLPHDVFVQVLCDDAFVMKLDSSGTQVLYATYLSGQGENVATSIAVDAAGEVYVTGYSSASNFPVTKGALQSNNKGPYIPRSGPGGPPLRQGDIFITKFKPDGSVAYSTLLGGTGVDVPARIQVDSAGFAYVAGYTDSPDFPLTPNPLYSNPFQGFVSKINPTGTALVFSTYFANPVKVLAIDPSGSAYIAGTGATSNGSAYLSKLSVLGNSIAYTKSLGVWSLDVSLAVDSHGQAWVNLGSLLQIAADGSRVTVIPNSSASSSFVAVDAADNVYVSGYRYGLVPSANAALFAPCSTTLGILELTATGDPVYASYLRQVPLSSNFWLTSPGHVLLDPTTRLDLTAKPPITFGCPVNGASFVHGYITRGEIVSLFGHGLGPTVGVTAQLNEEGLIPTSLAGVQVRVDGVPAPILYAQQGQINVVMPVKQFYFTMEVEYNGQSAPPLDLQLGENGPGIFAVLNQDGTVNSPSTPAVAGLTLQCFLTGISLRGTVTPADGEIVPLGPLMPLQYTPMVFFGAAPAEVSWAGLAPGLVLGIEQVNVRVPVGTPAGSVSLSFFGVPSANATVAVGN